MIRNRLPRFGAALLATCAAMACAAAGDTPPMYQIKKIKPDLTGNLSAIAASSINNHGIVVGPGYYQDSGPVYFVLEGRRPHPLSEPAGDMRGIDPSINDLGVVVGERSSTASMWSLDGQATDLSHLLPCEVDSISSATGINNRNEIVGDYSCVGGSDTKMGAWIYRNGAMTDLGKLGGIDNRAYAINNIGQVVGWADLQVNGKRVIHSYLWQDGLIKDLGTLGEDNSYATAINDSAQVVGIAYSDDSSAKKAFSYRDGKMKELPKCAGHAITPNAINNHGQIVGSFGVGRNPAGVLIQQGQCYLLDALLDDSGEGWSHLDPKDINEDGVIVGRGNKGAFVATPIKR